ncbi:MAG: hypothetical protein IKJ37_12235 [Kiritimatiellae bacterium]|nr:hypothetical protein [Kiritimatiellia bacterium]
MTKREVLKGKPYAGNPHAWFDGGEVAPCTAEASLRRVHCRRQPEAMTRPQVASRSEVARGLRASVCAATSRRGSLLYKKLAMMIGAAAVAVSVNADDVTVTQTVDNVKWQIQIGTTTTSAEPQTEDGNFIRLATGRTPYADCCAILDGCPETLFVPSYFTMEEKSYPVARVGGRGFYGLTAIKNITMPETMYLMATQIFTGCDNLENVRWKGPAMVQSGESQTYTSLGISGNSPFQTCEKLKLVFVDPNVTTRSKALILKTPAATGARFIVPLRDDNKTWEGATVEGDDNRIIYYGPGQEVDLTVNDNCVTIVPTTVNALTNALSWAQTFKTAFNLDTKISITNRIDLSVAVKEELLQNVTLEAPPWYLAFAVTSQAQLNNVLAAVSVDVPIIIDIEGVGRNQITVPDGRKVAILAKSGWTFGKKTEGLVVSFQ